MPKIKITRYKEELHIENNIFNSFKQILKDSLKQDNNEWIITQDLIKKNTNEIIENFNVYNNFIIYGDVQSGKTNNLITIVSKLFDEKKIDLVIYFTGSKNDLLDQNQTRFYETFDKIKNIENLINKNFEATSVEQKLKNNFLILHSLKISSNLQKTQNIINSISSNIKILIIDDEADETSLSKKSKIYFDFFASKKNVKTISITATPFKNLKNNHDYYDYYKVLESPKQYFGVNSFSKNIVISDEKIEETLLKSFIYWISINAINNIVDSQYLLNLLNLNNAHSWWRNHMRSIGEKLWNDQNFFDLTIKKYFPKFEKNKLTIYNFMKKELKPDSFKIINNQSDDKVSNNGLEVIIGGLRISRGITYENLIVEVMYNMGRKINASTLVQRARWCGYRNKAINMMKIYVNNDVFSGYEESKKLIEFTKRYQLKDNNFKESIKQFKFVYIEV